MMKTPKFRAPSHPGKMLLKEFLIPMSLTQRELAGAIHVPYQRVNEIIRWEARRYTPQALRLARFFGTSEDFWINLQMRCDLYAARQVEEESLKTIRQYVRAA